MAVYDLEPVEDILAVTKEKPSARSGGVGEGSDAEQMGVPESVGEKKSEVAKENSYEKILERVSSQAQPVTSVPVSSVKSDAATVDSFDEEARIQKLVNIALEKGPEHAFKVAIALDDMYAIDMLHDRLSHQLFQELVNKGMIKEE